MSNKGGDSIVRKNMLTEKEKTLKDKLFNKGPGTREKRMGGPPDEFARAPPKAMEKEIDSHLEKFIQELGTEVKKMNQGKLGSWQTISRKRCCRTRTRCS